MASMRRAAALAVAGGLAGSARGQVVITSSVDQCPGTLSLEGYGNISLVNAQWNMPDFPAGPVQAVGGTVMPDMWGRAYFADACTDGAYNNSQYLALKLLGKKLSYMTDVSQGGCGCNSAMYLVSMHQSPEVSGCYDHYCDANNVCGVRCAEIDVQEANRFAFHSALHTAWDGNGEAAGFGGWVRDNRYDFGAEEYGPGAKCVNTLLPYQVSVAFPLKPNGKLKGMEVTLSQNGGACELHINMYNYHSDPQLEELHRALEDGMTPVVSYWKSPDMLWLDGPGIGGGPCREDTTQCGTGTQFWNFAVESL